MNGILSLARPSLLTLNAYESARSLATQGRIFLDANESSHPPLTGSNLNRYPEPQPRALLERFSKIYGVPSSMLLTARGSDEAIDLLIRAFCEPGKDQILICPPTYGMYEICARIQGAGVLKVPLMIDSEEVLIDEVSIKKMLSSRSDIKILFLCSPNNPTGTAFSTLALNRVCESTLNRCLVVIDEAYAEFNDGTGMMNGLRRFPHLVILRTLSKAWALAGARCGVAIAHQEVIELLQKIRPPYPMCTPAIEAILEATDQRHHALLLQRIRKVQIQRDRLKLELFNIKTIKRVYDSSTNFILVEFENSARVLTSLKSKGILLRDRSSEPGLVNCIRITIGTDEENNEMLTAIREAIQ